MRFPGWLRLQSVLLTAVIAWGGIGWITAPSAQAQEDTVRHLDVIYDVQRDGTVDVTYTLDWDFGTTGRHGIELSLVTREVWDQDPLLEVVYEISDVAVTSPDGVPTDLDVYENDWSGSLDLRIGDPDETLDVDRAVYVVTYTLSGALRTFDGHPQLYWDVTSSDYPRVDSFGITVTGPGGVTRARCLVGSRACDASVSDGRAQLSGGDADRYQTITAVAEFEPGSIENAEPVLQARELREHTAVDVTATVTIDTDGVAHVEEQIQLIGGSRDTLVWEVPERSAQSSFRDVLYTISDLTLTDNTGGQLPVQRLVRDPGGSRQNAIFQSEVPGEPGDQIAVLASYSVTGAVHLLDSGTARFAWPLSSFRNRSYDIGSAETLTWEAPVPIQGLDCRFRSEITEEDARCYILDELSFDGTTATYTQEPEEGSFPSQWILIDMPAGEFGDLTPVTKLNSTARALLTAFAILASLGALLPLGYAVGRIRLGDARDARFDGVPPGAAGTATMITRAPRRGAVPVRFEPPEGTLLETGMVMTRSSKQRYLTAVLVNMAVHGAVTLETKPFGIKLVDYDGCRSSLERRIWRVLDKRPTRFLTPQAKESLQHEFSNAASIARDDSELFDKAKSTATWILRLVAVLILPVTAVIFGVSDLPRSFMATAVVGAFAFAIGVIFGLVKVTPPLTAKGTQLKEQAEGFRLYLRTAESRQLNFEADEDIFSRYLPWAVLFNDVKRWARVCEELATQGHIPAPDLSYISGATSISALTSQISSISGSVTPSSPGGSGSGSGGSSGFSGGGGGGGGGGGTSAGSW